MKRIYNKSMLNVTKIRLYPTTEQQESLAKAFGCARWFWNNSLAETQRVYAETGKGLGQYAFNSRLPSLKQELPWLAETHSQVLQSVSLHLSSAFVNFFERRGKYPSFKSKHRKQSIQYPQGAKLGTEHIWLPKIGKVSAVVHREIVGRIKTVTISKTPTNKYFASILTETPEVQPVASYEGKVLGIDVGLLHLVVTSDGSQFENPKHLRRAEKNLKRKQRKLARKQKSSKSREKARMTIARIHERIANCRKDWLHKVSRRLVDENQVLAVEDLNVKGMMQNHNLARAIGDAGWGMFTTFCQYKTARVGKGFVKVARMFPSSQLFRCCGKEYRIKLPLSVRSWKCPECGRMHDRDVNAAINIRNEAERLITAGNCGTAGGGAVSRRRGRKPSVLASACETGSPQL